VDKPVDYMDTSLKAIVEFTFSTTTGKNLSLDDELIGSLYSHVTMIVFSTVSDLPKFLATS
jgi:hypothetical protein